MILKVLRAGEWQEVEIDETQIITFPEGLVGCEEWHRFALWDELGEGIVWTLLSIDEPGISLLATNPDHIVSDYRVELTEADLGTLGLTDPDDELATLCILVVRQDPPKVTANLVGPLVINTRLKIGKQLVLANSDYSLRHPLDLTNLSCAGYSQ